MSPILAFHPIARGAVSPELGTVLFAKGEPKLAGTLNRRLQRRDRPGDRLLFNLTLSKRSFSGLFVQYSAHFEFNFEPFCHHFLALFPPDPNIATGPHPDDHRPLTPIKTLTSRR